MRFARLRRLRTAARARIGWRRQIRPAAMAIRIQNSAGQTPCQGIGKSVGVIAKLHLATLRRSVLAERHRTLLRSVAKNYCLLGSIISPPSFWAGVAFFGAGGG